MAKNLVIGGSGFIGSHIVQKLTQKNKESVILDRSKRPEFLPDEIKYVKSDTKDREKAKDALKETKTVFINSGRTGISESIKDPAQYYKDNFFSLKPLVEEIEERKTVKNVVIASTIQVYGEGAYKCEDCGLFFPDKRSKERLEREQWEYECRCGKTLKPRKIKIRHPKNPRNPYTRSKLALENYTLDRLSEKVNLTILRYPIVYGPRQGGAPDYFFRKISNNKSSEIYEDGKQLRDFIYVEDLAEINIEAAGKKRKIYNLGTGNPTSIENFTEKIASEANVPNTAQASGNYRAFDVRHNLPDVSKFDEDFSIKPRSLEKGIKKTLRFYRKTNE